jgi:hypothetical protein
MKNIFLSVVCVFGLIGCNCAQKQTTATSKTTSGTKTGTAYQRPINANAFVKAPSGSFGVWIDQQKWKPGDPNEETKTINFIHHKGIASAAITSDCTFVPIKTLRKYAIDNGRKRSADFHDFHILSEEKRSLNGKDILCLKIQVKIKNVPFTYLNYFYGGPEGYIQAFTCAPSILFDEYKSDLDDFLNGIQIGKEDEKAVPQGPTGIDILYAIRSYEKIQNRDNPSREDFKNSKGLMSYIREYSFCPHLSAPDSPSKGQATVEILKNYLFKHPDQIKDPAAVIILLAFIHHVKFDSAGSKKPSSDTIKSGSS